ncbi:LamG domain-containing protein [Nocardiopsis sp. CC223A]|uniref:LamG domain-containing protein n=1 Tax=Nocardiopsis sp. CC223A TaxID=3044051 RepID=UPI002795EB02|nr:LamG domain-containing protein [Nocardiopsis sp. CC223A]
MPYRARVWSAAVLAPALLFPVLSTPAHAEQEPVSETPAVSTTGPVIEGSTPETPVELSDFHGGACSSDPDAPLLINEVAPNFTAYVHDRDSTSSGRQKVKTEFAWFVDGFRIGGAESPSTDVAVWSSGSFQSADSSGLPEDVLIAYRARVHDGTSWSGWSSDCYLKVNTSRPDQGPAVTSTDYLADGMAHGSPGLPGEFTFSNNGVDTAEDYHYGFNDDSCTTKVTPSTQGGSVTLALTPRQEGPNWIYARTVDGFGNSSDCVLVYSFLVAPPSDPVAHIGFDEGEGNRAVDAIDPDRGATLSDGVDWVRGRVGTTDNPDTNPTPRMNGTAVHTSGYTDGAPGPFDEIDTDLLTVDTSGTFSVSVWVKLDHADADHTVVAQEGARQSAFRLGYDDDSGRWAFEMSPEDEYWDGSRPWGSVLSSEAAEVDVWTHLLGTHDSRTGEFILYVDGVEQGEATHTGGWNATGPLTVGRGLFQGIGDHYWPGAIDDIRVWDRMVHDQAVSDHELENEVWRLANRPVSPEGRWTLDEYDGTQVADSTDRGLDATLHGDPLTAWNFAENDVTFSPGVRLNGDGEHIETSGPALRTDRSFSVAAWVRLDETAQGADATAVSQSGQYQSAFHLGYQGSNGGWTFKLSPHDDSSAPGSEGWSRIYSTTPTLLGEWTHLVGVYDHTRKEMVLYVNGLEEARTSVDHAWHAEGGLRIGGARHQGVNDHYHWTGDIDDVHVYQGVLSERDINRVYMGEFPNIQI